MSYLIINNHRENSKRNSIYLNYVIGYKIGLIRKKAEENKIKIYDFSEDSFESNLKEEVEKDLNDENLN